MTKAELLKLLQDLDDNAELTVIDNGRGLYLFQPQ